VEQTENSGRERILARIRSALAAPAPKHAAAAALPAPIFPPVPDLLARFQEECVGNITECVLTRNSHGSAEALANVLASLPPGEIFIQDAPELRRIAPQRGADRPIRWSCEGPPNESSQATVTLAESLVASTGSVLVSSSCGGRNASVVAPVHIVVAGIAQLEPDLAAAFASARASDMAGKNSNVTLITGSSRTADIEKILVLGAHGPRRLVVILALES
jgi:L-lactate dehydrogenase complex protein LldG